MSAQDNLLIGPAKLFVAAAGTAVDTLANYQDDDAAGWTYLGNTTEGVSLSDAPEYARAMSQQSERALDVAVTSITTTIGTTLREVDANRLADFVRGTTNIDDNITTITPGGLGPTPKLALVLVGRWPGGDAVLYAARATLVGEREVVWSSADFTAIAVEFEVLTNGSDAAWTLDCVEAEEPEPEEEEEEPEV
jgi:hypothetical protein